MQSVHNHDRKGSSKKSKKNALSRRDKMIS